VIEGLGDEVVATVAQSVDVVGVQHRIGDVLLGEFSQRVGGGDFHFLVDGFGAHVQGAAKDKRKAEHVIDLIGIVAAAGGDDDVITRLAGFFVADFRIGVGHGEHRRIAGHRTHHVLGEDIGNAHPRENVGIDHGVGETAALGFLREVGLIAIVFRMFRIHILAL